MKADGAERSRISPGRGYSGLLALLLGWILLLAGAASAQSGAAQPPRPPQTPNASADRKITPKEAEDLFRSVDEILAFVSKDTGLPIKQKVQRKLADRDEVERYVARRMKEDKDAQRLERAAVSLKKFGLLPRDFQLPSFLLALLKEQVAGFYDSKTKTVYLLDWLDPDTQRPVLAHELTHALQDQNFDIEKWTDTGRVAKSDRDELGLEESRSAREAVLEGQAMMVLLDYMLAPVGRSVADSPALVDSMKSSMVEGGQTPLFSKAPLFLREALTFPYTHGLNFERQLLTKNGRDAAYRGVFDRPPLDTRQIMQPETYLANELVAPLELPKLDQALAPAYKRYDFGSLGQFDVHMLIWQWIGRNERLSSAWRGGYYYTYEKTAQPGSPYALVSLTRWATPTDASEFAGFYAASLIKRYKTVSEVRAMGPTGGEWQTDEGLVELYVSRGYMLSIEGLQPAERAAARQAVEKTFATVPVPIPSLTPAR